MEGSNAATMVVEVPCEIVLRTKFDMNCGVVVVVQPGGFLEEIRKRVAIGLVHKIVTPVGRYSHSPGGVIRSAWGGNGQNTRGCEQ